jgi:hypothetical protein
MAGTLNLQEVKKLRTLAGFDHFVFLQLRKLEALNRRCRHDKCGNAAFVDWSVTSLATTSEVVVLVRDD